jgi:trigger factor
VDLPDSLIDEETEHRVTHARERAEQIGMTLDQLLETQGFDGDRFRADAREHAVRAITADLVLESVARSEEIEVTTEELGREIAGLAAALGREPKDVAKSLDRTGQVVALAGDIIRSKALDVLVEHADITPEGSSGQVDTAGEDTLKEDSESSEASPEEPDRDQEPEPEETS